MISPLHRVWPCVTKSRSPLAVVAILTVLVITFPSTVLSEQTPQPTFRTGTEVIEIDVTVVSTQGEPVTDLRAPEFRVTVDGQPRRVVSAEFIDMRGQSSETQPGNADKPEVFYSSNLQGTRGRLIVVVVDRDNITFGNGSHVTRAASEFLDQLTRNDRVALVTLPQPGPFIDFTANHTLVQDSLDNMVGVEQSLMSDSFRLSLHEAFALARGEDEIVAVAVLDRHCGHLRPTSPERDVCESQVETAARQVVEQERSVTDRSLNTLESILEGLQSIEGPKHIIWISEGLVLDGSGAQISPIERAAAVARATIHVLMLDQPLGDITVAEMPNTPLEDRWRHEQGLSLLAAMTRGELRRVGPNPGAIFARIEKELQGYYLLGIESAAEDAEDESHTINVSVGRQGIRIRSRRQFIIPSSDTMVAGDPETRMRHTLSAPFTVGNLPLRVATYAFQAEDQEKVRVLVAAEINASGPSPSELVLGFSLRDLDGNIVASGEQQVTLEAIERPQGAVFEHAVAFITDPGSYVVKLAVADTNGLTGSIEHPLNAWQLTNLSFATADLLLADASGSSENGLIAPVEAQLSSNTLAVYTELYSEDPVKFNNLRVQVDVAKSETGKAWTTETSLPEPGMHPNERTVSVVVPVDTLPPGQYVARALVMRKEERLALLTRPFRITRPLVAAVARGPRVAANTMRPSATSRDVLVGLLGDALAFKGDDVLTPEVVTFFMDRIDEGRPALKEVTSEVRAGNLTGAGRNAFDTGDQMAAAFLRGLELFSQQQWNQAATQFSAALASAPDFSPASFYLGACYAISDRDHEAATQWRRALLASETAPFEHATLADALFRTDASRAAIPLLSEALKTWPTDDTLRRRLAIAHALELDYDKALAVIEPYVERHPTDHSALLIALVAMFSGHVDGRTPLDSDARERMQTFANAYGVARGPHIALVLDWVKFVSNP